MVESERAGEATVFVDPPVELDELFDDWDPQSWPSRFRDRCFRCFVRSKYSASVSMRLIVPIVLHVDRSCQALEQPDIGRRS